MELAGSRYSYHDAEWPEKAAEDGAKHATSRHNVALKAKKRQVINTNTP